MTTQHTPPFRKWAVTTAITAYQSYTVEAEDPETAALRVTTAFAGSDNANEVIETCVIGSFGDDEQVIEVKELVDVIA